MKYPPSLSRVHTVPKSTDQRPGHRERQVEREKEREARRVAIEGVMTLLPLKDGAEAGIRKMSGLFEQAYYAAERRIEDKPATSRVVEAEIKALAKCLKKAADHFQRLHPDTVRAWAAGADPALNGAALLLILMTAEDWAQSSVDIIKRVNRRGRTKDIKAEELRAIAAFAYENLTERKANIAYDDYSQRERKTEFVAFLERVFAIYAIQASPQSRARRRKPMTKKR